MARWHPRAPHTRSLLAAALVLSVAACGDDHTDDEGAVPTDGTSAVTSPSTLPTTVPDTPASSVPESTVAGDTTLPGEWPESVGEAVAALAADTGRDAADIEVVAHERVTWRNGALGCPEPGRSYTQALVPGYRIELTLDGETVSYHGSSDGAPFRCDDPEEPADVGGGVADA